MTSTQKPMLVKNSRKIREWVFKVRCPVYPGETVCVTGNILELGQWSHEKAIILHVDNSLTEQGSTSTSNGKSNTQLANSVMWTCRVKLPLGKKIEYRYFVCMLVDSPNSDETLHVVRRWETNLCPRKININEMPSDRPGVEEFGKYDGVEQFQHGWLTSETVIQFKLANEPLKFWRNKYKNAPIRLKMVTMNLSRQNSVDNSLESNSMDYLDTTSNSHWPLTEIAVMNEEEHELRLQAQFGRLYKNNEIMIFQAQVIQLSSVAYMIDFYMDSSTSEIPIHIGFCHILPLNFKQSIGTVVLPITSMRQEPLGQITLEYLIVRPMPDSCQCDLQVSYARYWKSSWVGLDVGHRGSGNSAKSFQACANLRENTIASLQYAAERGADFVEFDVQLSKDLVPVLFHDFYVNIGLEQKAKKGGELTTLTIPMKDLTLSQLHELKGFLFDGKNGCIISTALSLSNLSPETRKVYHLSEDFTKSENFEDLSNDHDPFPTLQHAFEVLNPHVGFNVEVKWTMQLKDGSWELENPIELNMYLDIVLAVVLKYAGTRKIVFSCFHPDICTMIRLKQNKYPVLFLTQGVTSKYPEYNDPRTQNIPIAIQYALSSSILGLSIHTEDILRDPSQVQQILSHGLVCFCWGEDNNNTATIKYLKELGLNGIIYDRIEDHIPDQKTNIFLIEDNEELMHIACQSTSVFSPSIIHSSMDFEDDEDEGEEDGENMEGQRTEISGGSIGIGNDGSNNTKNGS